MLPEMDEDGSDGQWDRARDTTWQVKATVPVNLDREAVRHFVERGVFLSVCQIGFGL